MGHLCNLILKKILVAQKLYKKGYSGFRKMKLATTLTVVAFVSVFMLELSVARYRKEKEPECKSGEVAMPSMTGGFHCRKKKAPLLKCEGKEAGECKRLCKEKLGEFQKDCAHLTHCDRARFHAVCNDLKSCRSD